MRLVAKAENLRRLLPGVWLGCALAACGQDVVQVKTNYYSVAGASARDIRVGINQARPWKDRGPGDGWTDWDIHWSFRSASSSAGCRLRSFETKTTITITLPKWVPASEAPPELAQRWDEYIKALQKHEEGHRALAQMAAAEMRKRVQAVKEAPTCDALAESIKKTANGTLLEYREKEAQYDRKTENGAIQGARFP